MNYKIFEKPDLHIHSIFSDGSDSPKELVEKIRLSGVDIFALTDHDTYDGCDKVKELLMPTDPYFVGGIELSCEDADGKYHLLGYCYDVNKPSIREAADIAHSARRQKTVNRISFLVNDCGYELPKNQIDEILKLENPGKPHFAALLVNNGYAKDFKEGFEIVSRYRGNERRLSPEEAIDAVLRADGIPVLAHGILADGSKNLSPEQIEKRVSRLKESGLMGLECFYSTYSDEQKKIMLSLADKYNLLVTAGSDYHGRNKSIALGDTNCPDKDRMLRFYKTVARLIEER